MAALSFAFLLCMAMNTIGSELKPRSDPSILDSFTALKQKVLDMENSIPLTIQAANDEMLAYILDKIANNSEMHEAHLKSLLSDHSLRVEHLEKRVAQRDDFTQLEQQLSNQTLRIEELSQQLEDVQSALTCIGEPPSLRHGRPVDVERKHGSVVLYRCHVNFVQTGHSTVRCHLGKWEGRPPLCTRPATSALSLRAHFGTGFLGRVINVSCFEGAKGQHVHFSRLLDTGTGVALPTAARTYTRGRVAVLDLSGVPDEDDWGVFQCESGNRKRTTFVINSNGEFVRPRVASVGDNETLGYDFKSDDPSFRWLHDGQRVPASDGQARVKIAGVRREDAGVYERYQEGDRRDTGLFTRLVVRDCPAGFFGQRCDQNCPKCYNGGVCHEKLGTCVCAPGFAGLQCDEACGRARVGPECSEACDGGDCTNQIFCQPDPYGCSCAARYAGETCGGGCGSGRFGADCKQSCHCKVVNCDPYTGACPGACSPGWTGVSCQIPAGN